MESSGPVNNIQLPFATSRAFIIGINDYEQVSKLSMAVNDATILAEQLEALYGYQIHGPLLNASKAERTQENHIRTSATRCDTCWFIEFRLLLG